MNKFPHEIARQSAPGSVERRLLWEIKRLQAVVLRADQLLQSGGDTGSGLPIIRDALQAELDAEACVREERARRNAARDHRSES